MKLLAAVRAGKVAEVKKLLAQRVEVNFADSETGETPLGVAAGNGNTQIVRVLLDAGADPDYSRGVDVPLEAAARAGQVDSPPRMRPAAR